jgi:ANTAR domain-containing protein
MMRDAGPGGRSGAGPPARGAAELASLSGLPPARSLHRLAELAALTLPGCSGATSTAWRDGDLLLTAASHPELAALLDAQLERGDGPVLDAVRTGRVTGCPDTLSALEWPAYAADALWAGIRCWQTLMYRRGQLAVALTMYGARPGALGPAVSRAASQLAVVGTAVLANAVHYDEARDEARSLQEAIGTQSVLNQAKGVLMHILACDEPDAAAQLRDMAARRNITMTEMAHQLIAGQPGP